jgi:RNA polymerase sigma factor for flagellar operon FliA
VIHGSRGDSLEHALWAQFKSSRHSDDREALIQMYLPFVRAIAAGLYKVRADDSVSFDDYVQYGRTGLLEAVDAYDFERGVPFSAYSSSRIRGAVLNGLAKESELAAQRKFWKSQARDRVESLSQAVASSFDRAGLAEIAAIAVGLAVGALLDDIVAPEAADPSIHSDPYAAIEAHQLASQAKRLIEQLPGHEREVIEGHYVRHLSFQQVAEQLGLSKGRISQIHAQALHRLRQWMDHRPGLDCRL